MLIQAGRLRPLKQTHLSTHGVLQIYRLFISLIVRARLWFVALATCLIPPFNKDTIWL